MPTARESVFCPEVTEIEDKMSELQTLDTTVSQIVSQSTQVLLVCVWTCGYCRRLLTKFAIPMVKVQLFEQDLLTSMFQ